MRKSQYYLVLLCWTQLPSALYSYPFDIIEDPDEVSSPPEDWKLWTNELCQNTELRTHPDFDKGCGVRMDDTAFSCPVECGPQKLNNVCKDYCSKYYEALEAESRKSSTVTPLNTTSYTDYYKTIDSKSRLDNRNTESYISGHERTGFHPIDIPISTAALIPVCILLAIALIGVICWFNRNELKQKFCSRSSSQLNRDDGSANEDETLAEPSAVVDEDLGKGESQQELETVNFISQTENNTQRNITTS